MTTPVLFSRSLAHATHALTMKRVLQLKSNSELQELFPQFRNLILRGDIEHAHFKRIIEGVIQIEWICVFGEWSTMYTGVYDETFRFSYPLNSKVKRKLLELVK